MREAPEVVLPRRLGRRLFAQLAAFRVSVPSLAVATIFAVAIAEFASGALAGLGALGAALLCAALSIVWARRSLGRRTGDTLGAAVAVAEVAVCLALLAAWRG